MPHTLSSAEVRGGVLTDVVMMGLRVVVGVVFIVHGVDKFDPGFAFALENWGIPVSMQIPVALGEVVPGVLLLIGVLTRISSGLLAIYMLGAIFMVKGATAFSGQGGAEYNILLLAASLLIVATGPGRVSLPHIINKIPRFIH